VAKVFAGHLGQTDFSRWMSDATARKYPIQASGNAMTQRAARYDFDA